MRKSFYLLVSGLMLVSGEVHSSINLDNYIPTLESGSAYDLSFSKQSGEMGSDFSSYELIDGVWTKVYYKQNLTVNTGPTNNYINGGTGGANINEHFVMLNSAPSSGGAIYNAYSNSIGNIVGDFINNRTVIGGGGAIYNEGGKLGNITGDFIGNYAVGGEAGAIYNYDSDIGAITGNFIGNTGDYSGGAIYNAGSDTTIANIIGNFVNNRALSGSGGAIHNHVASGGIGNISGDFIGNYASYSGGAVYNDYYTSITSLKGNFFNNTADESSGGAIFNMYSQIYEVQGNFIGNSSANTGGAVHNYGDVSVLNFLGSTSFIDNAVYKKDPYIEAEGGAMYTYRGQVSFNANEGDVVLFENNYIIDGSNKKLNSITLETDGETTLVNFNLDEGAYANVRDPIASGAYLYEPEKASVNKTGAGSLYLWGDNSEYHGNLNIDEGNFYAMFEENQTAEQQAVDPLGQRKDFNLNNATITFADGTYFRPMMNDAHNQLAVLTTNNSNLTVNGTAYLAPYGLSQLDVGSYYFFDDYDGKFSGWVSNLAEYYIKPGSGTELTIKSDLAGYDGLNYLADIYRKRSDLSLMEREVLDNIYITGLVPSGFHDLFEIIEGQDYEVFEQVHRASVRQFNRQVVSRIQNKNCESCGRDSGYSDQHFWFNVSHNEIKKDSTSKSLGYEYDPTGFAMGYDHDFIPNELNMGIAISYATGDVKNKTSGAIKSESNVDEYLMSFYGKYKPFRAYAAWNAGGGLMTNKTRLNSSTVNTRGEYDTYAFFANTELGYDWGKTTCELLETYVGLEYTHIFSEGYDERGIGARHFDRMDWDIFEVPIGVRASKDLFWNEYIFTPAIDLAYARNFGDTSAKTRAAFIGNRGDSWSISSSSDKRDSLRFNFNFKINNLILPFALNLGYSIDYRSDYTDQQFYGTLRWDF